MTGVVRMESRKGHEMTTSAQQVQSGSAASRIIVALPPLTSEDAISLHRLEGGGFALAIGLRRVPKWSILQRLAACTDRAALLEGWSAALDSPGRFLDGNREDDRADAARESSLTP